MKRDCQPQCGILAPIFRLGNPDLAFPNRNYLLIFACLIPSPDRLVGNVSERCESGRSMSHAKVARRFGRRLIVMKMRSRSFSAVTRLSALVESSFSLQPFRAASSY